MVPNSAGGHAYPVDDMTRLRRFLILGSEGGSYYADERKLTLENAAAVKRCIQQQGLATIGEIIKISQSGRASKVGPPALRPGDGRNLRAPGNPGTGFRILVADGPDGQPAPDVH